MRSIQVVLPFLLVAAASNAQAQERRKLLSFDEVAEFATAEDPIDVVRKDLGPYCFSRLDSRGERIITEAARRRNPNATAGVILDYIREHPCEPAPAPPPPIVAPPTTKGPRNTGPVTSRPGNNTGQPHVPSGSPPEGGLIEPNPVRRIVTPGNRCAVNQPPANPRDLRIPRYIRSFYVYIQTDGAAEEAESERLASSMPRDDFVKCFEAFRDFARARNMRLIITATDGDHHGWYQPEIRFKGRNLQVVDYKAPYEGRIYPGAEIPLS
jgi:hypothetical protein